MNEKIYRNALELLKERIDLYGTVIDPTPEDMRFICTTMQDIINNALSAGKKKKSYDKDRN
jgi:hypothetical protein